MSKTMQWIMSMPIEKQEEIFRTDPRADSIPDEAYEPSPTERTETEEDYDTLPF